MKIVCNRTILMDGITTVQKAVASKSTNPILECILLEVDDTFVMTASDLSLGIKQFIPSVILDKGALAINSRMFGDIVRKFTGEDISIESVNEGEVILECEGTVVNMRCLPADNFPAIEMFESDKEITIPQNIIRETVSQVFFAVGKDDFKPILSGILLEKDGFYLNFVAIDGMRIALRKFILTEENAEKENFKLVVPGTVFNEISKIMMPTDDPVRIKFTEKQIMFEMDDCTIVSRLLDGEYFNYKAAIPDNFSTNIIVNREHLLNSMEMALTVTMSERRFPVRFSINNDMLTISSTTDNNAFKDVIEVAMDGDPLEIGFNPRYYQEALKTIEDESIKICFTSNIGPCVIKSIDNDNYIYMILPLKLKEE